MPEQQKPKFNIRKAFSDTASSIGNRLRDFDDDMDNIPSFGAVVVTILGVILGVVWAGLSFKSHLDGADNRSLESVSMIRDIDVNDRAITLTDGHAIHVKTQAFKYFIDFDSKSLEIRSLDSTHKEIMSFAQFENSEFIEDVRLAAVDIANKIIRADQNVSADSSELKDEEYYQDVLGDAQTFLKDHGQPDNTQSSNLEDRQSEGHGQQPAVAPNSTSLNMTKPKLSLS